MTLNIYSTSFPWPVLVRVSKLLNCLRESPLQTKGEGIRVSSHGDNTDPYNTCVPGSTILHLITKSRTPRVILEQPCGTILSLPPHRAANQNTAFLSEWLVTVSPSTSSGAITDPRETERHSKWLNNYYQQIELLMVQKWFQTLLWGPALSCHPGIQGSPGLRRGPDGKKQLWKEKETGALTLVPRVLCHEWCCWGSSLTFQFPFTWGKKIYVYVCVYIYIFGDNSVLKDLGVNWKVWDELNLVFLDQRNSPLNAF